MQLMLLLVTLGLVICTSLICVQISAYKLVRSELQNDETVKKVLSDKDIGYFEYGNILKELKREEIRNERSLFFKNLRFKYYLIRCLTALMVFNLVLLYFYST